MAKERTGQLLTRVQSPHLPALGEMVPGFHAGGGGHTQATETPGKAQGLCQKILVWVLPECGQGHP